MVSRAGLHWAHIGCSLSKVSWKIRTRSYRVIADIVGTEDYFHHQRPAAPATEEAASAAAKERLEAFVKKRMEEDEPAPAATEAAPAPVAAAATAAPVAAVPAV
jgi:hypothetical protein